MDLCTHQQTRFRFWFPFLYRNARHGHNHGDTKVYNHLQECGVSDFGADVLLYADHVFRGFRPDAARSRYCGLCGFI